MEAYQYTIVSIIANLFLYVFVLLAVQVNCESRLGRWQTLLVDVFSFAGYAAIVLAVPMLTVIRPIAGWVYIIIVVELLHREKWQYKLVIGSSAVISMLLADVLFMAMMPREASVTGEVMQQYSIPIYAAFLFVNLVVHSIVVTFIKSLKKRNSGFLNGLWGMTFIVFPISQFLSLWFYFSGYKDLKTAFNPWQLLPAVLVYLLADVALFFALRTSEKNSRMQARNSMLEEQIAFQKDYYAKLSDSYAQVRKMRHDIDDHLYTMRAILEAGRTEDAARYVREVSFQDKAKTRFALCANMVIASYLEKKAEDLEASGITLTAEVILPSDTGISDPDLICAFANILNNAQEACTGADDAWVELRTVCREPYVTISCINPVGGEKEECRRIPELERGLGLSILKDLASLYDGEIQTEIREGLFRTQLVLKGESRE